MSIDGEFGSPSEYRLRLAHIRAEATGEPLAQVLSVFQGIGRYGVAGGGDGGSGGEDANVAQLAPELPLAPVIPLAAARAVRRGRDDQS